jgi:transcriptional regulator with XRE-family HTH domain
LTLASAFTLTPIICALENIIIIRLLAKVNIPEPHSTHQLGFLPAAISLSGDKRLSFYVDKRRYLLYNLPMSSSEVPIASFLKEIMRRRKLLPSQLAADLGISHATVSRWLSGKDIPNTKSCRRLAEYSGVPLEKILSIVGHLPRVAEAASTEWPEFREYARQKYPNELDEDLITMIEDLIERRRQKKYNSGKNSKVGS